MIAVPSRRRYGPAGTLSVTVVPPTATEAATGAAEEFTESVSVPPKLTPGIARETAAESLPASAARADEQQARGAGDRDRAERDRDVVRGDGDVARGAQVEREVAGQGAARRPRPARRSR